MTPHINANENDIAKIVLSPGDPLRAKYITDNFLENVKLINSLRGMYAYTGTYKGTRLTVMASGMGNPSIGIYSYELVHFYNVEKIIRIGTCGSFDPDVKLLDVILSTGACCKTYFHTLLDGGEGNFCTSSETLNEKIIQTAKEKNTSLKAGKTITSDVFDVYCDDKELFRSNFPNEKFLSVEMEAFGLFYVAKKLGKEATCLMTVVDSLFDKRSLSSEDREKSLNDMITLALDSVL